MSAMTDSARHRASTANPQFRGSHSSSTFAHNVRPKFLAAMSAVLGLGLMTAALTGVLSASAATDIVLGDAAGYAVLAATTVTDAGASRISGELGVAPGTSVTGFPPGIVVNGSIHSNDPATNAAEASAHSAYETAAAQPSDHLVGTSNLADAGPVGNVNTLTPGVYSSASSLGLTGTLVLDAQNNPDAVFLFQAGSTLTTASYSVVSLINGAQESHVFWQIGSSATLGTYSTMVGTILAHTAITSTTAVVTHGRLIALGAAVTLDGGSVTVPPAPVVPAVPVTETATPTPAPTETPNPTPTGAPTPTETPMPTSDPTEAPVPGEEPTATPTPSSTPTSDPTPATTASPTPSSTPTSDPTPTPTPTPIEVPVPEPTRAVAPTITSGSPGGGTVGSQYTYTVTATGYPEPTFTVSDGALPNGLSLDVASGVISGVPTFTGDFHFMITASNGVDPHSTGIYGMTVAPRPFGPQAPEITSGDAADGTVGTDYLFQVSATGFPAPTLALTGIIPAGVVWDATAGTISGIPTTPGDFTVTVVASNTAGTVSKVLGFSVVPAPQTPVIAGGGAADGDIVDGTIGEPYSATVTANGYPTPLLTLSGILPAGLSWNSDTSTVSGIPTTAGDYTVMVTATNVAGSDTRVFTLGVVPALQIPEITSGALPDGVTGTSYSFTVTAIGYPVPVVSVTGALPAGLNWDASNAVISGIPTVSGHFSLTAVATNSVGAVEKALTVIVTPALVAPRIAAGAGVGGDVVAGTVGAPYSAVVVATGYPKPTFTLTGILPSGLRWNAASGAISGIATTAGDYTVMITATNSAGADTRVFTLEVVPAVVPPTTLPPTTVPPVTVPPTTAPPSAADSSTSGFVRQGQLARIAVRPSPTLAQTSVSTASPAPSSTQCGVTHASGSKTDASLDVVRGQASALSTSGIGCTPLASSSDVASANRGLGSVPVWPIVATLLGLLSFVGSGAFVLVARKRRPDEVFDFQI